MSSGSPYYPQSIRSITIFLGVSFLVDRLFKKNMHNVLTILSLLYIEIQSKCRDQLIFLFTNLKGLSITASWNSSFNLRWLLERQYGNMLSHYRSGLRNSDFYRAKDCQLCNCVNKIYCFKSWPESKDIQWGLRIKVLIGNIAKFLWSKAITRTAILLPITVWWLIAKWLNGVQIHATCFKSIEWWKINWNKRKKVNETII